MSVDRFVENEDLGQMNKRMMMLIAKMGIRLGINLNFIFDPIHCLHLLIFRKGGLERPKGVAKNHHASRN